MLKCEIVSVYFSYLVSADSTTKAKIRRHFRPKIPSQCISPEVARPLKTPGRHLECYRLPAGGSEAALYKGDTFRDSSCLVHQNKLLVLPLLLRSFCWITGTQSVCIPATFIWESVVKSPPTCETQNKAQCGKSESSAAFLPGTLLPYLSFNTLNWHCWSVNLKGKCYLNYYFQAQYL